MKKNKKNKEYKSNILSGIRQELGFKNLSFIYYSRKEMQWIVGYKQKKYGIDKFEDLQSLVEFLITEANYY